MKSKYFFLIAIIVLVTSSVLFSCIKEKKSSITGNNYSVDVGNIDSVYKIGEFVKTREHYSNVPGDSLCQLEFFGNKNIASFIIADDNLLNHNFIEYQLLDNDGRLKEQLPYLVSNTLKITKTIYAFMPIEKEDYDLISSSKFDKEFIIQTNRIVLTLKDEICIIEIFGKARINEK